METSKDTDEEETKNDSKNPFKSKYGMVSSHKKGTNLRDYGEKLPMGSTKTKLPARFSRILEVTNPASALREPIAISMDFTNAEFNHDSDRILKSIGSSSDATLRKLRGEKEYPVDERIVETYKDFDGANTPVSPSIIVENFPGFSEVPHTQNHSEEKDTQLIAFTKSEMAAKSCTFPGFSTQGTWRQCSYSLVNARKKSVTCEESHKEEVEIGGLLKNHRTNGPFKASLEEQNSERQVYHDPGFSYNGVLSDLQTRSAIQLMTTSKPELKEVNNHTYTTKKLCKSIDAEKGHETRSRISSRPSSRKQKSLFNALDHTMSALAELSKDLPEEANFFNERTVTAHSSSVVETQIQRTSQVTYLKEKLHNSSSASSMCSTSVHSVKGHTKVNALKQIFSDPSPVTTAPSFSNSAARKSSQVEALKYKLLKSSDCTKPFHLVPTGKTVSQIDALNPNKDQKVNQREPKLVHDYTSSDHIQIKKKISELNSFFGAAGVSSPPSKLTSPLRYTENNSRGMLAQTDKDTCRPIAPIIRMSTVAAALSSLKSKSELNNLTFAQKKEFEASKSAKNAKKNGLIEKISILKKKMDKETRTADKLRKTEKRNSEDLVEIEPSTTFHQKKCEMSSAMLRMATILEAALIAQGNLPFDGRATPLINLKGGNLILTTRSKTNFEDDDRNAAIKTTLDDFICNRTSTKKNGEDFKLQKNSQVDKMKSVASTSPPSMLEVNDRNTALLSPPPLPPVLGASSGPAPAPPPLPGFLTSSQLPLHSPTPQPLVRHNAPTSRPNPPNSASTTTDTSRFAGATKPVVLSAKLKRVAAVKCHHGTFEEKRELFGAFFAASQLKPSEYSS